MDSVFSVLESLPENLAFDIFRKLDYLSEFPKVGSPLGARFPQLEGFRQLLYKRRTRIIYDFDEHDGTVYVLFIQDCRQELPSARDLKRDTARNDELPFE